MREQNEIDFDDDGPRRSGPWRLILIVALATFVAVMLVPGETPAPDPEAVAESGGGHDSDTPAPSLLARAEQSAPPDSSALLNLPDEPTAAGPASVASMAPAIETSPGDGARALIAEHRASGSGDFAGIVAAARQAQADAADADAYLLFFYAARGGNADAAFALAQQADPAQRSADGGLFDGPDLLQAFKWYESAQDAGHPLAATRLDALRRQVDAMASAGDLEAQRLTLMWR
jgi:TPR repeat protein